MVKFFHCQSFWQKRHPEGWKRHWRRSPHSPQTNGCPVFPLKAPEMEHPQIHKSCRYFGIVVEGRKRGDASFSTLIFFSLTQKCCFYRWVFFPLCLNVIEIPNLEKIFFHQFDTVKHYVFFFHSGRKINIWDLSNWQYKPRRNINLNCNCPFASAHVNCRICSCM